MNAIIETKNLTKYYGKKRGIEKLNLSIKEGETFGFLGPNGAGKTTTIKLLLRLINPTSGEALMFGKDIGKNYTSILDDVGYLSGDLSLYGKMSGKKLLDFSSSFYQKKNLEKYKKKIVERLKCDLETPFKKLSRGSRQKIGILLAIFHKPKLLILDEPTSGIDPLIQNEFYKILFDLKKEGTTIFFSSHNLPEVEEVCDRIGIIRDGKLVDVETIEELRRHRRKIVEIYFQEPFKIENFLDIKDIEIVRERDRYLYLYAKSSAIKSLLEILSGYKIKDINFSYPDLENVFLKYYEK